ncbi:MAG: type II toxin-antitoxin system HicA family toxin [Pyramidobacter sp.]|nr:type II toxin-antitoxin system HicA family toxin [Pyramidobacter sp.]
MNPRKTTLKKLKDAGFVLKRNGANHDIYFNPETRVMIPVKRHDFDENDMRYILKEARIKEDRK